jgi:glycopeptide antibiotics resistance protein
MARFNRVMQSSVAEHVSRTNYLANMLLFVPVGFGLSGALLLGRTRPIQAGLAGVFIVPASIAVSLMAEFLQVFVPGRIVSRHDVTAQTLGCLVGLAAWLAAGERLTGWLRTASDRHRGDRLARALSAYAVAWAFVNLAPFDITVDPGVLARRVRAGLVSVVPFANTGLSIERFAWEIVATTISAVPLGALGLVGWAGLGARRQSSAAFAFGAAAVLLMELAQIFVRSHAADGTDVVFGWLGVAIGVRIGRTALSHRAAEQLLPRHTISAHAAVALLAWCVLLCAYHWLPYDFVFDTDLVKDRLSRLSPVPFVGYWTGSELNVLKNVLVKVGLAAPFGVIAAFVVRHAEVGRNLLLAGWVIVAAVVFGVIEAGQMLLPSRTPDPTDVLMSVAGSAAGFWIGWWLKPEG